MRRLKCNNSKSYANYFGGLGFYYSKFLISRGRERERHFIHFPNIPRSVADPFHFDTVRNGSGSEDPFH